MRLIAAFVALLAADAYTTLVIYRAVFVFGCTGECADAVFWPSIAILGLILIGLCWLTWRVGKRLRATFASRSARPS